MFTQKGLVRDMGILDMLQEALLKFDDKGRLVYWNKVLEDLTGFNEKALKEVSLLDLFHATDASGLEKSFSDLFAGRLTEVKVNAKLCRKNGDYFWADVFFRLKKEDDGSPLIEGVVKPFPDGNFLENSNLSEKEEYKLLTENMQDLVSLHAPDSEYLYVSPSSKRLVGYEPEELVGRSPYDFIHPDDQEKIRKVRADIDANKRDEKDAVRFRFKHKEGKYTWLECVSKKRYDENGELKYFQSSCRNVDERVMAEEEKEKLAFFPEMNPEPVFECDTTGKVLYQNPAADKLLKEFDLEKFGDLLPEDHKALVKDALSERKVTSGDNEVRDRVFSWQYYGHPGFRIVHVYGSDITDQRKVERTILDAIVDTQERERERFARGLHEGIGQYLSAIKMNLQALKDDPNSSESLMERIDDLLNTAVKDVRNISHGLMPRMLKQFGLHPSLKDLLDNASKKSGIPIDYDLDLGQDRMEEKVEIGIYRVVQDLLEFAQEDLHPLRLKVHLKQKRRSLHLEFTCEVEHFSDTNMKAKGETEMNQFWARLNTLKGVGDLEVDDDGKVNAYLQVPL